MATKTRRAGPPSHHPHAQSTTTTNPTPMSLPSTLKIDLQSLLADPQPSPIPIYQDALEASLRQFMRGVSEYIENAMGEIEGRKVRRAAELKRLAERRAMMEGEMRECNVRELKLAEDLEREHQERTDAEFSLSALKRQCAIIEDKCAAIDAEIEQYRADVTALRQERQRDTDKLTKFATLTSPELKCCEDHLGMIIEGVDKDKLLIAFTQIDKADPSRRFSLVLDISARAYKVPVSTPPLPTLPFLLESLNESRDLYAFLKQVRACFVDMTASS